MYNVLVTGVGSVIGYGIIESLRIGSVDCRIIGTDIYAENFGKYRCDHFIQVPYTSSEGYAPAVKKIFSDYAIDLVFPGIEQDLYYYNENKSNFTTAIVLNNYHLVNLSKDKLAMYNFLKERNYPDLIPTFCGLDFEKAKNTVGLPFIVKPKSSYASKGFHFINNFEDYSQIEREISADTLFQPVVGTKDEEYTISVFGDGKGGYIDSLILRRYLSAAGASEKAFVINGDEQLMNSIAILVSIFKPEGPTNFQFRKNGNKVFLLEINPRISSACSIRTKFGYNDPLYCIQHYLQSKEYVILSKKNGRAIRYIKDEIIYE